MKDPGWAVAWRYALPLPGFVVRRVSWLRAPTALHRLRGATLGLAELAVMVGAGFAVLVHEHGRVRIGETSSGTVVIMGLLGLVIAVELWRTRRKHLDHVTPGAMAEVFSWRMYRVVGSGGAATLVLEATALFVGSWQLAAAGALPMFVTALAAAPTSSLIARSQRTLTGTGFEGVLLEELLRPDTDQ